MHVGDVGHAALPGQPNEAAVALARAMVLTRPRRSTCAAPTISQSPRRPDSRSVGIAAAGVRHRVSQSRLSISDRIIGLGAMSRCSQLIVAMIMSARASPLPAGDVGQRRHRACAGKASLSSWRRCAAMISSMDAAFRHA
jgi:hypothetical protein